MRNILVTGGAGFIGSHTVIELSKAGYLPIVIDNFSNSERTVLGGICEITGRKLISYDGDFQDIKLLEKINNQHKIDGIIHFAAFKAVGESVQKPLQYYKNNVCGLIDLLGFMESQSIKDLIFSSSCTVYGEPDKLPITERSPIKPAASPYGATKQMCENIIQDTTKASSSLRSLSLRYFNPIGAHPSALIGELPRGIPANLVPFITQTAAGARNELTIYGDDYSTPDGTCIRDYVHVVDLAAAHVKALQHVSKQESGYYETCNVGTGKGTSVLEAIKTFEKVSGKKIPYRVGPRREGDVVEIYAGVDKAEKMLGWKSQKSLAEAMADAWRWQQTFNAQTKTSNSPPG